MIVLETVVTSFPLYMSILSNVFCFEHLASIVDGERQAC